VCSVTGELTGREAGVAARGAVVAIELERYVTRAQLAEIMGVHVNTIDRLVREGMPSETWGVRTRRFRPSIAIAWARTRERRAA
jgi:phage terminase Nu1 subunit (DNA packaging protein)